jgi:hypothetical protein
VCAAVWAGQAMGLMRVNIIKCYWCKLEYRVYIRYIREYSALKGILGRVNECDMGHVCKGAREGEAKEGEVGCMCVMRGGQVYSMYSSFIPYMAIKGIVYMTCVG